MSPTVTLNSLVVPGAPICYGILMPGVDTPGGVPVVKVRDYDHRGVDVGQLLRATPEIEAPFRRSRLRGGDILMSIRGTTGVIAVAPISLDGANITQDTARIRVHERDRRYVFQMLQAPFVQQQIRLHTIGQAVKGINIGSVRQLQLPWPEEATREQMARVLEDCDSQHISIDALVELKRTFKRGLCQQLLSSTLRFPKFLHRSWSSLPLGELCEELTDRNGSQLGPESLMGVVKGIGLTPMRARVRGKDNLARCKLVPAGAFAYNPMRLNIGSIAYNDLDETVLVSPDYVVFRARPGIAEPEYVNQLRWSAKWSSFMERAGAGSVRVRIYYSDLERLRVPAPECDEQRRIAGVLGLLDREIDQLTRLQELLRSQKRGVLTSLLSSDSAVAA